MSRRSNLWAVVLAAGRVADTLRRLARHRPPMHSRPVAVRGAAASGLINLSIQHARMALTS
jgi:hypothetical protein